MSIPQQGGGPIESFDQLAAYMEAGCKPKDAWRIGTEHEKFGFTPDHRPASYEQIRTLMERLTMFGWTRVEEQGKLIGLTREGANISLEPGGQFELSGAPVRTIHETAAELENHLHEVAEVGGDLRFMSIGAAPEWTHDQMPVMPKGRYRLMTDYMGRVGTHGTQMMYRTSTVQVNLDFGSEADMVKKMRVAIALQPVATALFASSPFFDGKLNGHKSWRSRIWRGLDDSRTGMLPFVFDDGMGFQRYVDWVLDVPMYFVYRDGKYIDALGQSFRDFLKGQLPALPGELPTLSDWADHMTTVFPEARVKKYIEMRGADAGPASRLNALPAFWVGLMYGDTLDAAWDLVKGMDAEGRQALRVAASVDALQSEGMPDLAREAVRLSRAGLVARGEGEEAFLDVLEDSIASGRVPADDLIAAYNGEWGGDLSRVYDAMAL